MQSELDGYSVQSNGWYTKGQSGQKEPVSIRLNYEKAQLHVSGVKRQFAVRWSCDGVYLPKRTDLQNGVIRIRHAKYRSDCLHVADNRLVDQLKQLQPEDAANKQRNSRLKTIASWGLVAMLAVVAIAFVGSRLSAYIVNAAPDSWHQKFSGALFDSMIASAPLCREESAVVVVQRFVDDVATANQIQQPPQVMMIKSDRVFMAALPGQIAISSGYLEFMSSQTDFALDVAIQLQAHQAQTTQQQVIANAGLPLVLHSVLFNNVDHVVRAGFSPDGFGLTAQDANAEAQALLMLKRASLAPALASIPDTQLTRTRLRETQIRFFMPMHWQNLLAACH